MRQALVCLFPRDHAEFRVRSNRSLSGPKAVVARNDFVIGGVVRKWNDVLTFAARCVFPIVSVKAVLGLATGAIHHDRGADAQIKTVVVGITDGTSADTNVLGCVLFVSIEERKRYIEIREAHGFIA